jgi:hypothetical protein
MTKTEAREYALKVLAVEARHHAHNGSEWMEMPHGPVAGAKLDDEGKFSEADYKRIREAVESIADHLHATSLRLARSRIQREALALRRRVQKMGAGRP